MPVTLTDTSILTELLVARSSPRERLRRARGPLMDDLQARLLPLIGTHACPALFQVQQVARLDGYEVAAMQQTWGLFNPTRSIEASSWAVAQLCADVVHAASDALDGALARLGATAEVELLVVPGDPANRNLMVRSHGLSVCAVAPGWVLVEIWPSQGNLDHLMPSLVRAAAHQKFAQQLARIDQPVTLAQALQVEAGAGQLAEAMGHGPAATLGRRLFSPPVDYEATLEAIAGFYDLERYDELDTNIYGGLDRGGETRVPAFEHAPDMADDERAYTLEAIASEHDTTDPVRIASCLYGDPAVQAWGHPGGGYAMLAGLDACPFLEAGDSQLFSA